MEILENLSFSDYKKLDALSKHQLDDIHISIKYWQFKQQNPSVPSKSMVLGSAFHDLVLQPEIYNETWVVEPKVDLRTKAGKDLKEAFMTENAGKQFIDSETFGVISQMQAAINDHELAKDLLHNTKREVSVVNNKHVKFKCRADAISSDYIIDLKTTSSKTIDEFKREIFKFRYHVQAACYLDHFEMSDKKFLIIAVQTTEPFDVVVVYNLLDSTIQQGRDEYVADIAKYLLWRDAGIYNGLAQEMVQV